MAISLVQTVIQLGTNSSSGTALNGTLAQNTLAGDLLIFSTYTLKNIGSIRDIQGNSWNRIGSAVAGTGGTLNGWCDVWYTYNIIGGSWIGTFFYPGTSQVPNYILREYSGLGSIGNPLDQYEFNIISGTGSVINCGTTNITSFGSELVVGIGFGQGNFNSGTIQPTAGYGNGTQSVRVAVGMSSMMDKIVSTTGAQTGSMTVSAGNGALTGAIITFNTQVGIGTILYDNSASGSISSGTTISWTHTVNSNQQSILIVNIAQSVATGTITNIAYAGTNLTKVITAEGQNDTELWYLLSPPAGLGTITGTSNSTGASIGGFSVSYTGVSQTTPIHGSYSGTATGTLTLADTVLGGSNIVTGCFVGDGNTPTISIGTSHGTKVFLTEGLVQADLNTGTLQATNSIFTLSGVMAELNVGTPTAGTTGVIGPGFMSLLGVGQI